MKNPFTSLPFIDRTSFIFISFIYGIVFVENVVLLILRLYHHLPRPGIHIFVCLWCLALWILNYVRFLKWKRMQMIEELIEKDAA
jgi:uncharacterized membrane protein YidH (DUF202 family)